MNSTAMKRVIYVHYQKFERDGSHVHTTKFAEEFGKLCAKQAIDFQVIAPPKFRGVPGVATSRWQAIKTWLSHYYISDIKAVLVQFKRFFAERRQLQQLQPDIVLTRYEDNTLSIIWACRSLNIPVVLEINAPDDEARETEYLRVPGVEQFFSTTRALRKSQGAFAVSEVLAQKYRQQVPGKPVHSIPNGVSIEAFDPNTDGSEIRHKLNIPADRIVIGYVGSFAPWHGMGMLLDVFEELLAAGLPVHLLLVGQVRIDAQETVERAATPALAERVSFSGFVPSEEVYRYLAAMDITVLPNTAYYCSPLKLFEYMAMEKAVVSVNTQPVQEMLVNGEEGVLFPQGDAKALYAALANLSNDGELRSRLGKAARKRMSEQFTWRDNAQRVYQLLDEVCHQGAAVESTRQAQG